MTSPRSRMVRHLPGASRTAGVALLLATLAVLPSCASLGGGDPVVVKAEDVLVNSKTIWTAFMVYHEANSTKESPEVYRALEAARVEFPKAWFALDAGIEGYKKDKDASKLQKYVSAVEEILKSLRATGVI